MENMENTQQNVPQEQQNQPMQEQAASTESSLAGTPQSASFWQRFAAWLIDAIIVGLVTSPFSGSISTDGGFSASSSGTLPMVVGWIYSVAMIVNFGATLGKMALKIKVQSVETGGNLDYAHAILREVVGKFLSAMVLLLGYFWMLWDEKKQTWHDKIANSIVVKA